MVDGFKFICLVTFLINYDFQLRCPSVDICLNRTSQSLYFLLAWRGVELDDPGAYTLYALIFARIKGPFLDR